MPPQILTAGVKAVLVRCPEMVTLQVDALESPRAQGLLLGCLLLGCLQGGLGKVCELRVDVETVNLGPLTQLVHDSSGKTEWVSVRQVVLSMADHTMRRQWNRPMPAFLAEWPHMGLGGTGGHVRRMELYAMIVDLELAGRELALGDMLLIMARCGNLERFRAKKVVVDERIQEVSPVWMCSKMQELSVGFVLDALVTNANSQLQTITVLERSVQAAHRIAPSVMEQVGRLVTLHELGLYVNTPIKVGTSPFLKLAVGPLNGLGLLPQLGRLEKVEVTGLLHSVGHVELVWMKEHWPRLMSLSIPKGQDHGSTMVEDVDEQDLDQDYWKWRRRLKVKKGSKWSCGSFI